MGYCGTYDGCSDCTSHQDCAWCDLSGLCGDYDDKAWLNNCSASPIIYPYDCPDYSSDWWYTSWIFISIVCSLTFFLLLTCCICCLMKAGQRSYGKRNQVTAVAVMTKPDTPTSTQPGAVGAAPVVMAAAPPGAPGTGFYGPPPTFVQPPPTGVMIGVPTGPMYMYPPQQGLVVPQTGDGGPMPMGGATCVVPGAPPAAVGQTGDKHMSPRIPPAQADDFSPAREATPPKRVLSNESVELLKDQLQQEKERTAALNDRVKWMQQAMNIQEKTATTEKNPELSTARERAASPRATVIAEAMEAEQQVAQQGLTE